MKCGYGAEPGPPAGDRAGTGCRTRWALVADRRRGGPCRRRPACGAARTVPGTSRTGGPGRTIRAAGSAGRRGPGPHRPHRTWLRIVTGIENVMRWSSSRAPRIVLSSPFHARPRPAPVSRAVRLGPAELAGREGTKGHGLLTAQAAVTCGSARIRMPFHRAGQATHRRRHPPWAGTVDGRIPGSHPGKGHLPAGRSTDRAPDPRFPGYAPPRPAIGPAQHPAGLTEGRHAAAVHGAGHRPVSGTCDHDG